MNFRDAGDLKAKARQHGITADVMGLPPRYGESVNRSSNCSLVVWLSGMDHEFSDRTEADKWLTELLTIRGITC